MPSKAGFWSFALDALVFFYFSLKSKHIILLFFISSLKHVLSLDDLKLIFKGIHDFEELYNLFLNFSNSTDLISDLNISPISDELKKKLYLIIYYRNASIGKNLFNIL